MCGIAGMIDFERRPREADEIRKMLATLIHRGPDGEGWEQPVPGVVLGHRRLSIIDVEGGRQPISNETGKIWITFNGEIFNYRALREELIGKGHTFKTKSDTEVIVHLYEEEGTSCVERLNGQFAFALWDGERLFCARDPVGIKPFYYYHDRERFLFGSEPRAILAAPGFSPEIDLDSLRLYFRYRYIPAPRTAYLGMKKLRPGEALIVERDGKRICYRYWDLAPDAVEDLHDFESARSNLRETLEASVERQMISDVPIAGFLSGGIDSSCIVSLMARHAADPVRTFAIGFPDPKHDERAFARAVAEKVGTDHHDRVFGPDDAREVIPDLLDHLDEPFGDGSLIPTFGLCRQVRDHAKVALSGDGGDELFAGYSRYLRSMQVMAVPPWLRPFWHLARKKWPVTADPADWKYPDNGGVDRMFHHFMTRTSDRERSRLYGPALREGSGNHFEDPIADVFERYRNFPPLARLLAVDLHSLLSEYHLVKVDRASMRASLEVRVPFLDVEFVRAAFRLSPELRLHGGQTKGLLRKAMKDLLPETVARRGKMGFGPPLKYWFAGGGKLAGFVRERLEDSLAVKEGLLNRGAIESLLQGSGGKVKGVQIWRILVLESWLRGVRDGRFTRPVKSLVS